MREMSGNNHQLQGTWEMYYMCGFAAVVLNSFAPNCNILFKLKRPVVRHTPCALITDVLHCFWFRLVILGN